MDKFIEFKKVFDKYDGVVRTLEFVEAGYHHKYLKELMDKGIIRRIKRGYYEWQYKEIISDISIITKLFPDATIYLNSALYIYGYIDRTPNEWHLAVARGSARARFEIEYPKIKPYYIVESYITIGQTQTTYEGHEINIFDKDRTICDVVRYSNKLDREIVNQGIKSYIEDPEKNISNLMRYARKLRVEKRVKTMVEMWL